MEWFGLSGTEWPNNGGQTHRIGWEPDYGVELEGVQRIQRVGPQFASLQPTSVWGGRGGWRMTYAHYGKATSV